MAAGSLHWSQPSVHHSPSSSQTLPSAISSPSSERRSLGAGYAKLHSSLSFRNRNSRARIIRRALSASLDSFSDEEFSKKIEALALRFHPGHEDHDEDDYDCDNSSRTNDLDKNLRKLCDAVEPPDEIIPANIERKANSFDIPLSLRMIKRKIQLQDGIMEAKDSACCSVKKAFSSMVFIIRELQSYTLQMREILFYEDLQGILTNVQREMHATFVWLFEKVFSHTPILMMYLMILLANYSVYSMSAHAALAKTPPVQACQVDHDDNNYPSKISSVVKTLRLLPPSSSNGKTASIGGNSNGGGRKCKPVDSGMDGEGRFNESNYGGVGSISTNIFFSNMSRRASAEEEEVLWGSIVDETNEHSEYLRTDMFYQSELDQEPENTLLLANYAQFLYLVARDYDRAEEYFKRATKVEPKDDEALNKYANFLWVVRNDLLGAEEKYLEAISAEPDNSCYAANYAHFLWNTGGEDTCFPLSSIESNDDV
ncbi:Tetratricopeptide repeat (TPR)-like superfamily protein [Striga hermonthica]|uniref:Tetratricopeptide repeat (TPR)-like superfamily protein n=1 Tax=Striga hermonthica TaxID=68872 RepID=A0A9N7N207_STRHE|nr:Tetratricopeptide repeat (TPR)-like superfamily protein [Striga hermonthica]